MRRKLALTAALVVGALSAGAAAAGPPPSFPGQGHAHQLIGLSDPQVPVLESLLEDGAGTACRSHEHMFS